MLGRLGRTLQAALGMAVLAALSAAGAAEPSAPTTLAVDVGTHKLLRLPGTPARLAIGNPKVADVNLINGRDLLVNGKTVGVTNLMVWPRGKDAAPQEYRIEVGGLGGSSTSLIEHQAAVLGAGGGEGPAAIPDGSVVNVDSQVLSQIKIVEVSRSIAQEYGLNVFGVTGKGGNPLSIGRLQPGSSGGLSGTQVVLNGGGVPFTDAFNFVFGNQYFGSVLSLLESRGLARTLAEPSLTAMSGQTASFLAGGEFPIPVVQNGGGSTTGNSITIEFKEFGVRLSLTPTVLSKQRIALKVAPEVSELDFANGITLNNITVPALVVRRTDTMVELGDGESFVLSGLVSNTLKKNVEKVPWLGDIPVLGAFFRSNTFNRDDKELIMVVTPHIVRPIAKEAPLPPLPGAGADHFNPSFAQTVFMDNGTPGEMEFGFSKP